MSPDRLPWPIAQTQRRYSCYILATQLEAPLNLSIRPAAPTPQLADVQVQPVPGWLLGLFQGQGEHGFWSVHSAGQAGVKFVDSCHRQETSGCASEIELAGFAGSGRRPGG